tara:strand:- start:363 stop:536 length:174 start_codon:yes stop_codon:yes gene_type:complete
LILLYFISLGHAILPGALLSAWLKGSYTKGSIIEAGSNRELQLKEEVTNWLDNGIGQ